MPIPFDTIRLNIKEKRITRINQLFEYGTLAEWKAEIGLRKGVLEGLIADPKKWAWRYILKTSIATGIKDTTIERLIKGQRSFVWAMKRAGGQKGESPGPPRAGQS
jgi:hypothetical protein